VNEQSELVKWEGLVLTSSPEEQEADISIYGREGWELVAVIHGRLYFKRDMTKHASQAQINLFTLIGKRSFEWCKQLKMRWTGTAYEIVVEVWPGQADKAVLASGDALPLSCDGLAVVIEEARMDQ